MHSEFKLRNAYAIESGCLYNFSTPSLYRLTQSSNVDIKMAHALILGASGISGWSLLNQARNYPTPTTFARITGTTNRPLTLDQAHIPNDPRVQIASGIDFTKPAEEVARSLKEKIPDVSTVSHVFYTGKW